MENLQVDRFISEYWITSCVVNNCRHFVLGIIYMKYMCLIQVTEVAKQNLLFTSKRLFKGPVIPNISFRNAVWGHVPFCSK